MVINKKEKILGSWWVLISFIPVLSGLSFIIAGTMSKNKKWKILGFIYIILQIVCFGLFEDDQSNLSNILANIGMIIWIINIIHAFYIRKEYFVRRKILKENRNIINRKEAEKDKKLINKAYKDILGEDINSINNIDNEYDFNQELKYNKIIDNKNIRDTEILEKLDINSCSDGELSQIPGIGIILSKKAMDIRRKQQQFNSLNEFYEILNISSDKRNKLNNYLECKIRNINEGKNVSTKTNNQEAEENTNRVGRKIDF